MKTGIRFTLQLAASSLMLAASVKVSAQHSPVISDDYRTEVVTSGLNQPWAVAHLPNGDILITERGGSLRVVRDGRLLDQAVDNVPEVYFAGQGGLLDVLIDADFSTSNTIYLSFAHGTSDANATRLISAQLKLRGDNNNPEYSLENVTPIFTASPLKRGPQHYSGRIEQLRDKTLLLTVGDGFDYREDAQRLDSHLGKIIRINRDGSVPQDNPFVNHEKAKPEIWSYGHRNHQAIALIGDAVYQNEHGPQGGDEVNLIKPGINYGWPIATKGRDYNGARISPFSSYPNTKAPMIDWTPSIAPSSMVYYRGRLYATALAEQSIRALSVQNEAVVDLGKVFTGIEGRLRDISVGIDDKLYVLGDGDQAELIKITFTLLR